MLLIYKIVVSYIQHESKTMVSETVFFLNYLATDMIRLLYIAILVCICSYYNVTQAKYNR